MQNTLERWAELPLLAGTSSFEGLRGTAVSAVAWITTADAAVPRVGLSGVVHQLIRNRPLGSTGQRRAAEKYSGKPLVAKGHVYGIAFPYLVLGIKEGRKLGGIVPRNGEDRDRIGIEPRRIARDHLTL